MTWSFRKLLIGFALLLSLASTLSLNYFFMNLFEGEKIKSLFETELSNTKRGATHLEHLLQLANLIDIKKVPNSRELIFLYEDPCDRTIPLRGAISENFKRQFQELEIDPRKWVDSLEVFKACTDLRERLALAKTKQDMGRDVASAPGPGILGPVFVSSAVNIMVPYILTLIPGIEHFRLAMISMDGFLTSSANTLFLVTQIGEVVWAADGPEYVRAALSETRVSQRELAEASAAALTKRTSKTNWTESDGLLSSTAVSETWTLMSLSYRPAVLKPVQLVLIRFSVLSLGIFFLCFLIGKKFAEYLSYPLQQLGFSAERVGSGNFTSKLEVRGLEEFSTVYLAFNKMMDKIQELFIETKKSAGLESELLLAQQVQKLLIPPPSLETEQYRIVSYVKNAEFCGGDWWGYLEIPRNDAPPLLLIMCGDVTDHGSPSALVTATVRGAESMLAAWIQDNADIASDPRRVLTFMNRTVWDAAKGALSMSMVAAVLDLHNQVMSCANAGHTLPYILKKGAMKTIAKPGIPLGQDAASVYEDIETHPWEPGSQLFMYTDGLIDAYQGDLNLFERKNLQKYLKANLGSPAKNLLSDLLRLREKTTQGVKQADDVTVVICEVKETDRG